MDGIKILYIEDEPFLGKIVKETLESRAYHVLMLEDGRDMEKHLKEFQPDICLLDIMLPYKDGYTLGKEIKDLNLDLPIIFLTAKNQTSDVLKGFESGGNDYIRKPFSMEELIARINNLLSLKAQRNIIAEKDIILGKYTFDFRKYELRLADKVQKLSYREAELLKILAEHKNQTIERKFILKSIWGDDTFFNSRNLDVYITKLRSFLKEDEKVKIITLKGIGYQFISD